MKLAGIALAAVLIGLARGAEDRFEVPEPQIEAFSPKGLRISLPDSKDIESVEFFVSFPDCPQPLIKEVNETDGRFWVFWNPDLSLRSNDRLRYRLMVQRKGSYWKKEGNHVVQKVLPLTNNTARTEIKNPQVIPALASVAALEDRTKELITSGKTSSFKSSYSTQKNSQLKPITKSSMSTTSGTFFIKPSGVMEATGYKKGSSFDSTKREGEQWQHYHSELTAEELENMKNLYGSGFQDFHGLFPTSGKTYEKSYMTSESKTFPATLIRYGESQPLTTQQFHETHKTHETFTHSKPVFQFSGAGGAGFTESNSKTEKLYRVEPFSGLPNPLPPQGTIFKTTEYVRQEHTAPVDRPAPQKIVHVSQSGDFSTRSQPVASGRGDQLEYNSGNLQTVQRQDYSARHYLGNIFTSVKASKVKSPEECSLVPGVDYAGGQSLRDVEKYVYELSCLATLMESTTKEEMALLKQKNGELTRRLEILEHEVKRISNTCNCYE